MLGVWIFPVLVEADLIYSHLGWNNSYARELREVNPAVGGTRYVAKYEKENSAPGGPIETQRPLVVVSMSRPRSEQRWSGLLWLSPPSLKLSTRSRSERSSQAQAGGLTSEQAGLQLHSAPAGLSSSSPRSPPSPWPPSSGFWPQTAA